MDHQWSGDGNRISRATLTAQLEEALRVDILEGVLRPGQRIRAHEMTQRYGVSATPLREALQRLAVENLVELDPRLGATVARISERDLRGIYEMLQLLDGMALERSIQRGDDQWVAHLDTAFDRLCEALEAEAAITEATDDATRRRVSLAGSSAHWEFHHALYKACDSEWLMRFVRQLHAHAERYRMRAAHAAEGKRDSRAEHEHIYLAAKRRDTEAAVTALREHLGLTVDLLMDAIRREQLPEASPPETEASAR